MVKQVGIAKKLGLNLIWLPFIYKKLNINFFHKIFDKSAGWMARGKRQEVGMLALCAQILIWVSVSGEKAPNVP